MQYAFADFAVDPALRELRRGQNLVALEPKGFDLLVYLITHRDRVISKDELVDQIWHGRFVSDAAVSSALRDLRRALGDDGKTQRFVKTVRGHGVRFMGDIQVFDTSVGPGSSDQGALPNQRIRYCRSKDGTRIAFAVAGEGPPLVKTSHWLTHLEYDWQSPIWAHINFALAETFSLLRYDARGSGLSQWDVDDFSLDRQVEDFAAVVDAAGLDRFPIIGISQAAAFSVAYAAKYPERVSKLILYGGYDRGWRRAGDAKTVQSVESFLALIENDWGQSMAGPELLSATYMPDAKPEYWRWFGELQRKASSGKNAAGLMRDLADLDIGDLLPLVKAPTLVMHARGDLGVEYFRGQNLAAGIPGARFLSLETRNHFLLREDPAWREALRHIREFLDD